MIANGVQIRLASPLPSRPPSFASIIRCCLPISSFIQRLLLLHFVLPAPTLSLRGNLCPRLYPLNRSLFLLLVNMVQHPSPRRTRVLRSAPSPRLFTTSFPFHFHVTAARLPLTWCNRPLLRCCNVQPRVRWWRPGRPRFPSSNLRPLKPRLNLPCRLQRCHFFVLL